MIEHFSAKWRKSHLQGEVPHWNILLCSICKGLPLHHLVLMCSSRLPVCGQSVQGYLDNCEHMVKQRGEGLQLQSLTTAKK